MSEDIPRKHFYQHLYALGAEERIEVWKQDGRWIARGTAQFPPEVDREILALLDRLNAL